MLTTPRQRHDQYCSRWIELSRPHIVIKTAGVKGEEVKGERVDGREDSHFEADVMQVLGVLPDDLLDEVGVSGAQVKCSRLTELQLRPPPQIRGVKDVIPAH